MLKNLEFVFSIVQNGSKILITEGSGDIFQESTEGCTVKYFDFDLPANFKRGTSVLTNMKFTREKDQVSII